MAFGLEQVLKIKILRCHPVIELINHINDVAKGLITTLNFNKKKIFSSLDMGSGKSMSVKEFVVTWKATNQRKIHFF